MTVRVPMALRRQRGRKRVVAPDGTEIAPTREPTIDSALVKAIARAHRWRQMLKDGEYQTRHDLAKAERINSSYVSRLLRLTLLSPAMLELVLAGHQPEGLMLKPRLRGFSSDWQEQESILDEKV